MEAQRARELLDGISHGASFNGLVDEAQELRALGYVEGVASAERASLEAAVGQLPRLVAQLRDLRRQVDALKGPKVARSPDAVLPKLTGTRLELLNLTDQVEDLSRRKTMLDNIVPGPNPEGFLRATEPGREALAHLEVWGDRWKSRDLASFAQWIATLEGSMTSAVKRGQAVAAWIRGDAPAVAMMVARAAGLVLARRSDPPEGLYQAFQSYLPGLPKDVGDEDEVTFLAATLATLSTPPEATLRSFLAYRDGVRPLLGVGTQTASESAWVAASLADLLPEAYPYIPARFQQLRDAMPGVPALGLGILTRSAFEVNEVAARHAVAADAIRARGYPVDFASSIGASLLSASPYPKEQFAPRFGAIDEPLRDVIPTPAAAALLASTPLSPTEAWGAFQAAIGEISWDAYFDTTAEIDYLALLLVDGMSALAAPGGEMVSGTLPSAGFAPPPAAFSNAVFPAMYRWAVYPHYTAFVMTHPVHFHAVPAFG